MAVGNGRDGGEYYGSISFFILSKYTHHAYPQFHFYYHTKQWDGYGKREEGKNTKSPKAPICSDSNETNRGNGRG